MNGESLRASNTVLVAGATGYLGGYVASACRAAGYRVRALSRPGSQHRLPPGCCDELFLGEATQYEELEGVCQGIDIAFSSIGIR